MTTREETLIVPLPLHRRRWAWITLGAALAAAILAGVFVGRFLRFDLPDVRALEDYDPPVMSRVMADDGSMVASFAEERRILIDYPEIPESFRQALVATEDSNFFEHPGIDLKGIARALWADVRHLEMKEGASTLTQQLARNLFLHPQKTWRRKAQEAVLALEIERNYTKEEILRFYTNQVYMGAGRYGLEAASRYFFGKPAHELSLAESATLAGMVQRPSALSPFRNPTGVLERRNHVLRRMREEGFISAEQAEAASAEPLGVVAERRTDNPAPYFVEEVRRWLQEQYGSSNLYKEGFEVETTLDLRLQRIANRAVDMGLRRLDKRQGWRGVDRHVPDGEDPDTWESDDWDLGVHPGTVVDGVVVETERGSARVRVGRYEGTLGADGVAWTGKKDPAALLDRGDVIRVRVDGVDDDGGARIELEQEPAAEAALVALDPTTGAIRALVGGFDFERSEFDRAIQAKRQTGSAFKPFVYAAALGRGHTLADTVLDEPTVFLDPRNPEQPYQPENYTNEYYETLTLRTALEKSANIGTVKLLTEIGYQPVIDTARRLGIHADLQPYPSLALGAFEISLLDLTAAYGAFANQGVLVEPHLVDEVRNRDGALVHRVEPEVRDAVRPEIAYLMNRVLAGVIADGTGHAAAALGLPLAGKTGTTDDNTDAWFIGYSPDLALGVWVGFDERRSLGRRETGAQAALPIWQAFMEQAYEDRDKPQDFAQPPGIRFVTIDKKTGLRANQRAGCNPVLSEAFVQGTEPTVYCSQQHHELLHFPYPFQRYAINDRGALEIPSDELDRLLMQEVDVFLVDDASRLEAWMNDGTFTVPVEVLPPSGRPELPPRLAERVDASAWRGIDGRPARIVLLD